MLYARSLWRVLIFCMCLGEEIIGNPLYWSRDMYTTFLQGAEYVHQPKDDLVGVVKLLYLARDPVSLRFLRKFEVANNDSRERRARKVDCTARSWDVVESFAPDVIRQLFSAAEGCDYDKMLKLLTLALAPVENVVSV